VNSIAFLNTVSKAIKFRTCNYIPNRKWSNTRQHWQESCANIQMLDSPFGVSSVIRKSNQYSRTSRKQLLLLISIWQIPMNMFPKLNETIAFYKSKCVQHFKACHFRQYFQYWLDIWQVNSISSPQLEAYPPITVNRNSYHATSWLWETLHYTTV